MGSCARATWLAIVAVATAANISRDPVVLMVLGMPLEDTVYWGSEDTLVVVQLVSTGAAHPTVSYFSGFLAYLIGNQELAK